MYCDGKKTRLYKGIQDKGHKNELDEFVRHYRENDDLSDEFSVAVSVTRATFAILESLSTGKPQKVD